MAQYILRRLLASLLVLFGVSVVIFSMIHLVPGDPVLLMVSAADVSKKDVEQLRAELGLNRPLYVQYVEYMSHVVRGDLGRSIFTNRAVWDEILFRLPSTIELATAAMSVAVACGVVLGILAAVKRNTWIDTLCMLFALFGVSMPIFWSGLLVLSIFSFTLGWFPATGTGGINRLVLPALTLGWITSGLTARITRTSMLEVLAQEYVVTARAKGLQERVVLYGHALKNALIPVVTIMGVQFGTLLAGTVVTETIFARPGVGRMLVDAIFRRDFPLVQGTVLVIATTYALVNLLVDISYGFFDPRIRFGAKT
ncbi:MAG: ABC transporter permease [Chloroflexi bacterium]|nr:ABC transporter permease [Chloroflexota bacterium]